MNQITFQIIFPVQERHLLAKHRPNIKLKGSPKPILTPNKPRSVPLIPLASSPPTPSSPPSSPLYSQQTCLLYTSDAPDE